MLIRLLLKTILSVYCTQSRSRVPSSRGVIGPLSKFKRSTLATTQHNKWIKYGLSHEPWSHVQITPISPTGNNRKFQFATLHKEGLDSMALNSRMEEETEIAGHPFITVNLLKIICKHVFHKFETCSQEDNLFPLNMAQHGTVAYYYREFCQVGLLVDWKSRSDKTSRLWSQVQWKKLRILLKSRKIRTLNAEEAGQIISSTNPNRITLRCKQTRGFVPLLASMQQCSHSFTQKSKHSQQKQKRVRPIACINAAMQPFLHAEIKGAEPDCIRSKEGLKTQALIPM